MTSLNLTWRSDSENRKTIYWRPRGSGIYTAVAAGRSIPWPGRAGWFTHSALLSGLTPDSEIDVAIGNASFADVVYVPPENSVTVVFGGDWQNPYDYGDAHRLALYGQRAAALGAHLYIELGDYVDDNGSTASTQRTRWKNFLSTKAKHWRRGDAQLPGVWIMGNHEGTVPASNDGGDGTPGIMPSLFSTGYWSESPVSGPNRSSFAVRIGAELGIIGLESDHTVPIIDQLAWFESALYDLYPQVRHIVVVAHASPFVTALRWNFEHASQSGTIRNRFWPSMEPYADKIAFWIGGHQHVCSDTGPKVIDYDPVLTEEQNALRWRTVSQSVGVRSLCVGPAAAEPRDNPRGSEVTAQSTIDASERCIAAYGYNNSTATLSTFGPITNARNECRSVVVATFSATGFTADFVAEDGTVFYSVNEPF